MSSAESGGLTWRSYVGLFLVCCATLLTEIVLTRYFSFTIWYHFAYMAISVALLGYGAAGSAYFAWPSLTRAGVEPVLARLSLLAAVTAVAALLLAARIPFDPFLLFPQGRPTLAASPEQILYLLCLYSTVTVPFFLAGLAVTIVLSHSGRRAGAFYFADLLGAGIGCALAVYLLTPLGAPGVVLASSVLFAVAAALWGPEQRWVRTGAVLWVVFVVAFSGPLTRWSEGRPASNKFLARLFANGNAAHLFSAWSPVYRVDVLGGNPERPWRMARAAAWGISPKFAGQPPENLVITHDGDASTMMYRYDGDPEAMEILDYSILRLPYLNLSRPRVLIVGVGGGVDVHAALRFGAEEITGVELNPVTVHALLDRFRDYNGGVFLRPNVKIAIDEGRNFIRNRGGSYDLIEFTGIDTLAAVYSGAYVLAESYLYTREAMREYWERLSPNGIVSFVRGDWGFADRPPIQLMRLANVAIETLREAGVANPRAHLVVISSRPRPGVPGPPIFNLQIRKTPFDEPALARLLSHASEYGYEVWYAPDRPRDNPVARLIQPDPAARAWLIESLPYNVSPPTDDQPFFFNFMKWSRLGTAIWQRSDYTFASGQLVLLAILAQAALLAIVFIVLPLLRLRRTTVAARPGPFLLYFAALGFGFILIEISYVQRFTLFLGSPVYSLAVIIAAMLVFAGCGSFATGPLLRGVSATQAVIFLLSLLAAVNLLYAAFLPSILTHFLGTSFATRVMVTLLLLAPLAAVMGTFLPIGLRVLDEHAPSLIPWAWAVNGVTSVVGSILCIVLAMIWGFRAVNLLALGIYTIGAMALLTTLRQPARVASQLRSPA